MRSPAKGDLVAGVRPVLPSFDDEFRKIVHLREEGGDVFIGDGVTPICFHQLSKVIESLR